MSISRQAGRLATISVKNYMKSRKEEPVKEIKNKGLLAPKTMLKSNNVVEPSSAAKKVVSYIDIIREAMKQGDKNGV